MIIIRNLPSRGRRQGSRTRSYNRAVQAIFRALHSIVNAMWNIGRRRMMRDGGGGTADFGTILLSFS